jgi:hypothetical protein
MPTHVRPGPGLAIMESCSLQMASSAIKMWAWFAWQDGGFAGNWLWRAEKLWRTCMSVTLVQRSAAARVHSWPQGAFAAETDSVDLIDFGHSDKKDAFPSCNASFTMAGEDNQSRPATTSVATAGTSTASVSQAGTIPPTGTNPSYAQQ